MPFFDNISTSDGTIQIWKLSEHLEEFNTLGNLNSDDKSKYDQLKSERRRKEFLASRILIQQLMPSAKLLYNQSGKPFLNNASKHIS